MRRRHLLLGALWPAGAALVSLFDPSPYVLHVLVMAGIYVILVQSLNLVFGLGGLLSLATPAFFGIGAYATTLLTLHFGLDSTLSFALAVAVSFVAAILVGVPSLRMSSHSFVIVTLSFALLAQLVAFHWVALTRGAMGISSIPAPDFLGFTWNDKVHWLYAVLIADVLTVLLYLRIATFAPRARHGRDAGQRNPGPRRRHRHLAGQDVHVRGLGRHGRVRRRLVRPLHLGHRSRGVRLRGHRERPGDGGPGRQRHPVRADLGGGGVHPSFPSCCASRPTRAPCSTAPFCWSASSPSPAGWGGCAFPGWDCDGRKRHDRRPRRRRPVQALLRRRRRRRGRLRAAPRRHHRADRPQRVGQVDPVRLHHRLHRDRRRPHPPRRGGTSPASAPTASRGAA